MSTYSFMPMDAPNWDDLREDEWTRAEGGSLPAPIYLRIERASNGAPIITGMLLGVSWPRGEIGANYLRDIKPRELLNALFASYDPNEPPPYDEWEESLTWGLMHEVYMMRLPRTSLDSAAVRGAGTEDRLVEFARVYMREMSLHPKRAMTATAKVMNVSRATANRWAEQARDRGLLPPRTGRGVKPTVDESGSAPEDEGQHT